MAIKSIRVKLNRPGIVALLQSSEVAADLDERTERIAAAAGDGFEAAVVRNRDRAVGFVRTATTEARRAEAESRALTRELDAGR